MENPAEHNLDTAKLLLKSHKRFIQDVHTQQRLTWFPLLILSFVTFLAIPVEHFSHSGIGKCGVIGSGNLVRSVCRIYSPAGLIYWPIALTLSYILISIMYRKSSSRNGVETSMTGYTKVGIFLAIVLTLGSIATAQISVGNMGVFGRWQDSIVMDLLLRLIGPASSIGIALLFLARMESNKPLLAVSIIFLLVDLWPVHLRLTPNSGFWSTAPIRMTEGSILLLASMGFAFATVKKSDKEQ